MRIFFLIILACVFVSCNRQPINTVTDFSLSAFQVQKELNTAGIFISSQAIFADPNYAVPSLAWVENTLAPAFYSFKAQLQTSTYAPVENDCDDYARGAAFYAQYLHHNTKNKLANTALCFGEYWYTTGTGTGHAINIFLYRDQAKRIKIGFFEPQTCKIVTLLPFELATGGYYRF